jgi:hypothetical protein
MDPNVQQAVSLLWQIAMGISLAACAGLRAFLPLLVVGVAGKLELIPLTRYFEWLATWPALIVFGVAVVVEILGDKFPAIDNFLDALQTFVKPIAGAILAASVLTELSPLQATALGLVAGGGSAGAVHLGKAKLRLASTLTTAGTANPVLSVIEDLGAFVGSIAAIVVPILMLFLLILFLILAILAFRHWRRRAAANPATPT